MATQWYYSKQGQKHGPIYSEQLKRLAIAGVVKASDLVWREGLTEWVRADKVVRLFPQGAVTPPLPPRASDVSAQEKSPPKTAAPSKRSLVPGATAATFLLVIFLCGFAIGIFQPFGSDGDQTLADARQNLIDTAEKMEEPFDYINVRALIIAAESRPDDYPWRTLDGWFLKNYTPETNAAYRKWRSAYFASRSKPE